MSTLALLVCLLAADPLEEIKDRIAELQSDNAAVVMEAYERLQVLTKSPNRARAHAAKTAVAAYEQKNGRPRELAGKNSREDLARFTAEELRQDSLRISGAKDFYNDNGVLRVTYPRLNGLTVETTDFGDEQLRPALESKRLVDLALFKTAVTGKDFARLKMPRLTMLTLEGSPVGDAEICALNPVNLPELVILDLIDTKITDKMLAECQLTGIKALYINDTAVTRDGLRSLSRYPALQSLRMDFRSFDPAILAEIAAGKSPIKFLRLAYTVAEEEAAKSMAKNAPPGLNLMIRPK
ncbi:hypothetical protein [Anatilimnocola floriformis]|uniref:hypothetical protein n=1 Tax=Anatilimnocola floriformis TaxID=2948575 RepID=UPI0020C1D095|nr:hypothetical protein [Anatilimnocola floriformis]